ncbi:MAG: hypothetical protein IK139_03630 [Lachnospiraceae bacterium]|nr:hypothetical protein [Lachnospiraceae bacterium]
MAQIDRNELTGEQIEKAMSCKTAEELMKAAAEEGFELTKEEAEAYFDEMSDMELDEEALDEVAGGDRRYKPDAPMYKYK